MELFESIDKVARDTGCTTSSHFQFHIPDGTKIPSAVVVEFLKDKAVVAQFAHSFIDSAPFFVYGGAGMEFIVCTAVYRTALEALRTVLTDLVEDVA
jgi:hypothetical protein